jgi:exodeoxyribonuclease VII small subunit
MAECNFEKDLDKLEQIVSMLEEGGLSLDDSLKQFEQGIKLARRCERTLSEAEKRIEILTKKASGELVAEPFEDEAESDGKAAAAPVVEERTVVTEKKIEVVSEKRRAPVQKNDDEENESEGVMLF